ncbi:MAG: hypothetical protein U0169_02460 [Polyangiaceae bacterium]
MTVAAFGLVVHVFLALQTQDGGPRAPSGAPAAKSGAAPEPKAEAKATPAAPATSGTSSSAVPAVPGQPDQPRQPALQPRQPEQPRQPLQPWEEDRLAREELDRIRAEQRARGATESGSLFQPGAQLQRGRLVTSNFGAGAAGGIGGAVAAEGVAPTGAQKFISGLRVDVFGGLNDNTYQSVTPSDPRVIKRHAAVMGGLELASDFLYTTANGTQHSLRLGARGQAYAGLDNAPQTPDGNISGGFSSRFPLGPQTALTVGVLGALQKINSLRITDGIALQLDPTSVNRTFLTTGVEGGLQHVVSKRWTVEQTLSVQAITTLEQPPLDLPGGSTAIARRGLDFVTANSGTEAAYDVDDKNRLFFSGQYTFTRAVFLLDVTQVPPRDVGPDDFHQVVPTIGHAHMWSERWQTEVRAGVTFLTASRLDPDQSVSVTPTGNASLAYASPYFQMVAGVGYINAPLTARLGVGPNVTGNLTLSGVPFPNKLRRFSVLGQSNVNYATVGAVEGTPGVTFYTVAGGAAMRYGLTETIGLIGGYEGRYTSLGQGPEIAPFFRNLVYLGLSAFFSTDRTRPASTGFVQTQ